MTVQNFREGEVNIICQSTVYLAYGEHECMNVALLCWSSKVHHRECQLLGTDVLKQLGFCVLSPDKRGDVTDLLGTGDWQLHPVPQNADPPKEEQNASLPKEEQNEVVTISLLQTVRIRAHHCHLA